MKKWTTYPVGICLLTASLSFSSCMENKLDLNEDVDLTVSVGGESLSLPFGNTDPIYLKDFIKTEDSDLLNVVQNGDHEGEYYLQKSDVISAADVRVANFTVPQKTIPATLFTVYPVSNVPGFVHDDYTATGIDVNFDYTFESTNAPTEVKLLKEVTAVGGRVAMTLSFHIDGPISACDGFDLSGLNLHFPDFVEMEPTAGLDLTTNVFSFNGETLAKGVREYTRTFYAKKFNFRDEPDGGLTVANNGSFSYTSSFRIEGSATVLDIYPAQVTSDIKITPVVSFNAIQVASVIGRVDPKVTINSTTVDLGDIPDFLNDDEVEMDLLNPMIVLSVTNPVDMPISLSAIMQGKKGTTSVTGSKVMIGEDHGKTPVIIAPKATTKIAFSRLGMGAPTDAHDIRVEDLNNLIRTIPDLIQFDIAAHAVQSVDHTIELGRSYSIDASYDVDLALSFGPDLTIVYKDTMDGWNKDIEDLEVKQLVISADVENTVPLEMTVLATAVDVNEQPIAGIKIEVPNKVNACNADGSASTSALTIDITSTTGSLKQLDGVLLRVVAKTGNVVVGLPLKNSQSLVLKNMKAKVPGGIVINANND